MCVRMCGCVCVVVCAYGYIEPTLVSIQYPSIYVCRERLEREKEPEKEKSGSDGDRERDRETRERTERE